MFAQEPSGCVTKKTCEAACSIKDSVGCMRLGKMYATGLNVENDPKQALKYYQMACDYGFGYQCLLLAWEVQYGAKLTEDEKIIGRFRKKACEKGEERGCKPAPSDSSAPLPTPAATSDVAGDGHSMQTNPPAPLPPGIPPAPSADKLPCDSPKLSAISSPSTPIIFSEWEIDHPPVLIKRIDPRHSGYEGKVFMELLIDEQGEVADIRILRSDNKKLEEASITAVRQWRYSPPSHCGKPVKTHKNVTTIFTVQR
jgi:TonB family protein